MGHDVELSDEIYYAAVSLLVTFKLQRLVSLFYNLIVDKN